MTLAFWFWLFFIFLLLSGGGWFWEKSRPWAPVGWWLFALLCLGILGFATFGGPVKG